MDLRFRMPWSSATSSGRTVREMLARRTTMYRKMAMATTTHAAHRTPLIFASKGARIVRAITTAATRTISEMLL